MSMSNWKWYDGTVATLTTYTSTNTNTNISTDEYYIPYTADDVKFEWHFCDKNIEFPSIVSEEDKKADFNKKDKRFVKLNSIEE